MDGVYREYRPEGDVVDCVWMSTRVGVQRVIPDGCMDLMWFGDKLVVAGPDTVANLATVGGFVAGVRFRPGMAPGFLGVPANELKNTRVPLADLWPREQVDRLTDTIHNGQAGRALLAAVKPADTDPFAAEVHRLITKDVKEIADTLNVSERQLHRRCLQKFGYGPKTLHRVLRFTEAMARAYEGEPFANVAHQSGYADQAHFAREVKDLAGTTLTELVRKPT